jgi:hypothetical protein
MITVKRLDTNGDIPGEPIIDPIVGKNVPAMIATGQASLGDGFGLQNIQMTIPYRPIYVGNLLKVIDGTQGKPYMSLVTSVSIDCSDGKSLMTLTLLRARW